MYTIQYEAMDGTHKMQTLDTGSRTRLLIQLAGFTRPIVAVYEQATPITKAVQRDLAKWPGSKSPAAMDFAFGSMVRNLL